MRVTTRSAGIEILEGRIAPASLGGMPIDLMEASDLEIVGAAQGDYAGYQVSGAGDVNGDGFDDALIGVFRSTGQGASGGAAFVVFGSESGLGKIDLGLLDGSRGFRIDGLPVGDGLGISVSAAGDVNGDGLGDIIIGAVNPNNFTVEQPPGAAYVVFGKAAGFAARVDVTTLDGTNGLKLAGFAAFSQTGRSVSGAGDFNGDGLDDILIGAPYAGTAGIGTGDAYLVFGRTSGFSPALDLAALNGSDGVRIVGSATGRAFGVQVSGAGDVNGDGFDDIVVATSSSSPSTYVFFGTGAPLGAQLDADGLDGSNGFSVMSSGSVATGNGDINGDGFDDIFIGRAGRGNTASSLVVVFGKAGAFDAALNPFDFDGSDGFRLLAPYSYYGFAGSLSSAGDINGDGFDDLLIGNSNKLIPNLPNVSEVSKSGGAMVLLGSASKIDGSVFLSDIDASRSLNFTGPLHAGEGVAGLGDFNGDGLDDLLIGVPKLGGYGSTKTEGTVYVVNGHPTIAIGDASGFEGNAGSRALDFPITLSSPLDHKLKVVVSIKGGTATPGVDFGGALRQTLTFAPGETSKVVSISMVGDEVFEPDETLQVKIKAKSPDVLVGPANAIGSIFDDDVAPGVIRLQHLGSHDGMTIPDEPGVRIGDFNGDGWDDFALGEPESSVNGPRSGAVYVVFGTAAGYPHGLDLSTLDGANGFRVLGQSANESVGLVLANLGDLNGDGLADLSIGASYARIGNPAYVIFGTSGAVAADFDVTTLDGVNGFQIKGVGGALTRIGDFNGDGIADFIGRPLTDTLPVIFGSDHAFPAVWDVSGLDGTNGFQFKLDEEPDFGVALDAAGDVNGDGFDDIILGVQLADANGSASGAAYVLFGGNNARPAEWSVADLDGVNGFTLVGAKSGDRAGRSVSGLGDVNGDGFDDVIVGAPYAGGFEDTVGKNYVVFGHGGIFSPSVNLGTLDGTNGLFLKGEASGDLVKRAGDVNGDGLADILILAPGAEVTMHDGFTSIQQGIDGGSAYVVYGSRGSFPKAATLDSLSPMQRLRIDGFPGNAGFIYSVDSAGDVNGDGFDDVLVKTGDDTGATRQAVIYGSPAIQLGDRKMTFTDIDGDPVIVKTSAGTLNRSDFLFQKTDAGLVLEKLDLTNHSDLAGETLTVKAKASATGDGRATIGTIDVTGLKLAHVKLKGVNGTVVGDSVGGSSSGLIIVLSSSTTLTIPVFGVEPIGDILNPADSVASEIDAPVTVTDIMAASDQALIARIAKVLISKKAEGSVAAGDAFGLAAEEIGKVKFAKTNLPLTSTTKDDLRIGAMNNDLRVVEV